MESRLFVGGINGVGKSSVVNETLIKRPRLEKLHTASMFMEWLGISVGNYDQLRALPEDYKQKENDAMLENFLSGPGAKDRDIIFDSHYMNIVEGRTSRLIRGIWPRHLGALVLVEADVEIVHQRIYEDDRDRHLFPAQTSRGKQLDILERHKQVTRTEWSSLARRFKLPSYHIENNGLLSEAADALIAIYDEQSTSAIDSHSLKHQDE